MKPYRKSFFKNIKLNPKIPFLKKTFPYGFPVMFKILSVILDILYWVLRFIIRFIIGLLFVSFCLFILFLGYELVFFTCSFIYKMGFYGLKFINVKSADEGSIFGFGCFISVCILISYFIGKEVSKKFLK